MGSVIQPYCYIPSKFMQYLKKIMNPYLQQVYDSALQNLKPKTPTIHQISTIFLFNMLQKVSCKSLLKHLQ